MNRKRGSLPQRQKLPSQPIGTPLSPVPGIRCAPDNGRLPHASVILQTAQTSKLTINC